MQQLIRTLLGLLSLLPLPALYTLSTSVYFVSYYIVRWRRSLVMENLNRSFPEMSISDRRRICREHFKGLFDTAFETLKAPKLGPEDLREKVEFANLEILQNLQDKPFILAAAHQGNWEWQVLALGDELNVPLDAIYSPSGIPSVDDFLRSTRTRFGTTLIAPQDALAQIAKRHKTPRGIVILADQNPRRDVERYWTEFLNQDTAFQVGLQKIARLTRYPIVFLNGQRLSRGHYRVRFELICEPPYAKEGSELLKQYTVALAASIEANPGEWLWSYDRWRYPKPMYG
ncbi:MAG: hypothetical protein GKR90_10040 [Pseudomonadales bacterium]|nr:hypothetical protein [Pseudomonadales bacterium]